MRSMTWEQVRGLRLGRAHLSKRTDRSIEQVARDLGGIHAQVTSAAETSLGVRIDALRVADVRAALWEKRSLVKAWTLRGTLHLHPSDELSMWIAARAAVTSGIQDRTLDHHGLDRKRSNAITDAIAEVLDGQCLSRKDLAGAVAKKVGKWAQEPLMSGWGTMLGQATLRGWLCHGPPQGNTVTFVRADQWVEPWIAQDPHEALKSVAKRYIRQFGPVTHSSFYAWFNGPAFKVAGARELFGQLQDEIEQVDVDGQRMWMLRDDPSQESSPPSVRFLPLYDCYLTGFRERENLLSHEAVAFAKSHPKGRLEGPVAVQWLLINGIVAGTWTRSGKGKRYEVAAQTFVKANRTISNALKEEAQVLGDFWGMDVDLVMTTA